MVGRRTTAFRSARRLGGGLRDLHAQSGRHHSGLELRLAIFGESTVESLDVCGLDLGSGMQ